MTPRVEIAMPDHCRAVRMSRPMSHPTIAATTGIIAEKKLDFAIPKVLILFTHSENARLEHSAVRQMRGYHTSEDR